MSIVLVGTVESTRTALQALIESDAQLALVITLVRDRAARHSDWVDVAATASDKGIRTVLAADVNSSNVHEAIATHAPEWIYVIGWSQICKAPFLSLAKRGVVGYHPSALPKNRGRAVIPWTILQGVNSTGSTMFLMNEGIDDGDILAQRMFDVAEDETVRSLYDKHLAALRDLIHDMVHDPTARRRPQQHAAATYCSQRIDGDGHIDWFAPARNVWTLIRATGRPYPGAFAVRRDERLRIWRADLVVDAPYWGVPGQVQAVVDGGALVQCGDREHVLLREVSVGNRPSAPACDVLRVQDRLAGPTARTFPS